MSTIDAIRSNLSSTGLLKGFVESKFFSSVTTLTKLSSSLLSLPLFFVGLPLFFGDDEDDEEEGEIRGSNAVVLTDLDLMDLALMALALMALALMALAPLGAILSL